MSTKGKSWETPLNEMKITKDKAIIKSVPILSTGLWKGSLVTEDNIDEVINFQENDGPCHIVLDHEENVQTWIGTGTNYTKKTHEDGYVLVLADLEIIDVPTIQKLKLIKEKGGGLFGISPRIEWDERDEYGTITGLKTPHISIVVNPAQGHITRLSDSGTFVVEFVDLQKPDICRCPKCGTTKDKKLGTPCRDFKCPKCGTVMIGSTKKEGDHSMKTELELMSIKEFEEKKMAETHDAICPECNKKIDMKEGKCTGCGKSIEDLGFVIPFPFDEIGEDEDIVLPKEMAAEIDQIMGNPNADMPAMKGLMQKITEQLKKKKKDKKEEPEEDDPEKDDEPEGENPKDKKKDKPAPEKSKNKSYSLPSTEGIEKVKDNIWTKELVRPGVFLHPEGMGYIPINADFMKEVITNTDNVFSGRVPVFIGHPEEGKENADKVVGWLSDLSLDKSMRGNVEVTNKLAQDKVDEKTLRDASLCIAPKFQDEHGEIHGPTITHLAITATPYFRGLEEFKRLVASDTQIEVEELVEAEDSPFGESDAIRKELDDLSAKYEELMKAKLQESEDVALSRVVKLIDAELLKPGAKERHEGFVRKAVGLKFDDKRSMAEEVLEILEAGLVKGEMSLTGRETGETGGTQEYLTAEDVDMFTGRLTGFERDGVIAKDDRDRPYWTKGRPEK